MSEDDFKRIKPRKKSQIQRNSFSSKFPVIDEKEDDISNSKLQSNEKLLSVIGQNLLQNTSNMNDSLSNISNNNNENKMVASTKSNNTNTNTLTDNKTIGSKEKENSSLKDKINAQNQKKPSQFSPLELSKWSYQTDLTIFLNGKEVKKSEEEIALDKKIDVLDTFWKSYSKNKDLKQIYDNKESNYSSSNIGNAAKSSSSKSDEKNMKINLQNILENDRNERKYKMNYPCIILSDRINIENNENKLDILMKTMEDYKDIVVEKAYCKSFQDRIILSIYISLSQMSFKLYNCVENNKKLGHLRKYICGMTNNIYYNLFNNPNFTLNSINQKFIEIIDIKNQGNNNHSKSSSEMTASSKSSNEKSENSGKSGKSGKSEKSGKTEKNEKSEKSDKSEKSERSEKSDEKTVEKNNDSSLNFNSNSNYSSSNSNSNSNSNTNSNNINVRESFKSFFDDEDEEIIYENFEDFKENDKDFFYPVNNPLFESDINAKDNINSNILNNLENITNIRKRASTNANNDYSPKLAKNKLRRNAAHKIAFEKGSKNNNMTNYNGANTNNAKHKEYDFQVIDVNGEEDKNDSDDDSIDSEEGCFEVHENHKNDTPKLLFYEDHVRDKDKRKINKINHVEIKPDPKFMRDKARIKDLNDLGYNNIISIINKDSKLLPQYKDYSNPFDFADYIKDKERKALRQQNKFNLNSSKKLPNVKYSKKKSNDYDDMNNSFFTHIYSKSNSFLQDNEDNDDSDDSNNNNMNNIIKFDNDDD